MYVGGKTLLTKAIEDNETPSTVEAIIKAGADVNCPNSQGMTALMLAVIVRRLEILNVLIQYGADPKLKTTKCISAIALCLEEELYSYLEILLRQNMNNVDAMCEHLEEICLLSRHTNTHYKEKNRSDYVFPYFNVDSRLLSAIKNVYDVNLVDMNGNTPLMHAVRCHYDDCVRLLLLAGADVNKINKNKETALTIAMTRSHHSIRKDLIRAGALQGHHRDESSTLNFGMIKMILDYLKQNGLFNTADIYGKTAMMYATEGEGKDCIMYAVEIDIEEFVKAKDATAQYIENGCDGVSVLSLCAANETERNFKESNDELVKAKSKFHDNSGRPFIMYFFETGQMLLDSYIQRRVSGSVEYRDGDGRTILMNCFRFYDKNSFSIYSKLILNFVQTNNAPSKASIKFSFQLTYKTIEGLFCGKANLRDNSGDSTVIYAIRYCDFLTEEITKLLVGDTHKEQYQDGKTALMMVVIGYKGGSHKYIEPLIRDSCTIQDNDGKTALMYALSNNLIPDDLLKTLIGDSQNVQYNNGKTALMYAFIHKSKFSDEIIEVLAAETPYSQDNAGKNALMYAFEYNHNLKYTIIKKLFGDKVDIRDNEENTTLIYAPTYGENTKIEITSLLVGDRLKDRYKKGQTALMIALEFHNKNPNFSRGYCDNDISTLEMFLLRHRSGYFSQNFKGDMPSHHDSEHIEGHYLKLLVGESWNIQDDVGKTALMYALTKTEGISENILQLMIGDSQNIQDEHDKTALMYAFIYKNKISEELICHLAGETPFIQDNAGKTALMYAFEGNQYLTYSCIQKLLGGKVDICDNEGKTHLIYALKFYSYINEDIANLLVGDTHKDQYQHGQTALMIALESNTKLVSIQQFIESLIDCSCDVQDSSGQTALMYAIKHNCRLPEHLFEQMITETQFIQDKDGKTALMYASQISSFSNSLIIKLFHKDAINMQDNEGKTALHHAIKHNKTNDYIEQLILSGSNLDIKDNQNRTALVTCLELDTRVTGYSSEQQEKFIKTKMLLKYNPIPRIGLFGKKVLLKSIENGMFSLKNLQKNKEIFRLIVVNGIVPFPQLHAKMSMFFAVLKENQMDVVKYLIANMYLNNEDLMLLIKAKNYFKTRKNPRKHKMPFNGTYLDLRSPDLQNLIIGATSQPWPLVKLSFLVVSSAVGHGTNREDRVNRLPLPNPIKDCLMFSTRTALIPVSEWSNIPIVFDTVEYEKTRRPRPLLNYWPFGAELVV